MFAYSRPGGNTNGGSAAPKEIQQAWWTGWKKFHRMKWQTVILANGMDLNVFGPLSARKNDLASLERSNFEDLYYHHSNTGCHRDRPRGLYLIIQSLVMILFMILRMDRLRMKINSINH